MDDTPPTLARGAYLLPKAGKVSGKNRRCQFDQNELCHVFRKTWIQKYSLRITSV
jgi:hypothetical protein